MTHRSDVHYDWLHLGVKLGEFMLGSSKRGKSGRHTALITPVKTHTYENSEEREDTFVEFSNFNELREVFEEAIRSMEDQPDVRKLSDPSS